MLKNIILCAGFAITTQAAFAGPICSSPKDKWQDPAQFQSKLKSQGYEIKNFKVTKGQCYEIYGFDKTGERVEIYFDPASGKVLQVK